MAFDKIKKGKILVEINTLEVEKILNIFWIKNIRVYKAQRKNAATIVLEIDYLDYLEVKSVVSELGGRINIIKSRGFIFFLGNIKKRSSLAVGAILFFSIMYYLSTYIWAIEIDVKKNITPFEIRKQLESIGIKPGITKKSIDVKAVEKNLENLSSEVLWLRARIEGGTLKVVVEEKINPPQAQDYEYGNLIATREGEVKRVYTFSGRAKIKQGQVVKSGDVVIEGIDGNEEQEYILPPRGIVIANTFYEKDMNVQIQGNKLERNGDIDSDIYFEILGKKIYLKKATKNFEHYDKIEMSGKIFNKVLYYERIEKEIDLSEDEGVEIAIRELEKSLMNELSREAKVVNKLISKEMNDKENLLVKVEFVVEQNIASDVTVEY